MKNISVYLYESLHIKESISAENIKKIFDQDLIILFSEKINQNAYINTETEEIIFVADPNDCKEYITNYNKYKDDLKIAFIPNYDPDDYDDEEFGDLWIEGGWSLDDIEFIENITPSVVKQILNQDQIILFSENVEQHSYRNTATDDLIFVANPKDCKEYITNYNKYKDLKIAFIPDWYDPNEYGGEDHFGDAWVSGRYELDDLEFIKK